MTRPPTLIRIIGAADGSPCPFAGQYVSRADCDAHGGRGELETTAHAAMALQFPDSETAIEFWRQQSTRHPTRPDGKPNRPLTAYTCDIGPAENAPDMTPDQFAYALLTALAKHGRK